MLNQKYKIICSVCEQNILDTENIKEFNKFFFSKHTKKIEITSDLHRQSGFLCDACFNMLNKNVEKVVKSATKIGNSSHILLPKKWENKKVISYLIE
jgi:putative transposon-encoded protein